MRAGREEGDSTRAPRAGRPLAPVVAALLVGAAIGAALAFLGLSLPGRAGVRPDLMAFLAPLAAEAAALLGLGVLLAYVMRRRFRGRLEAERHAASRAVGDLDARLLAVSEAASSDQRRAASEREVLLREIHHRVRNNLQIIQSLLRLGSRRLAPESREPFDAAVRRIGIMARVHTLLYASPDLASIDLRDYLEGLVDDLREAFSADTRGIVVEIAAERLRIPLDTAVPLAFIAAELLTNAFQHAFPADHPGGTITIDAVRENGLARLTVRDDGVGLAAPMAGSLGLTMVEKLVQQIEGTLEPAQGGLAGFSVAFPLARPAAMAGVPAPATPPASRPAAAVEGGRA